MAKIKKLEAPEEKQNRIKSIMDKAAAQLDKEGVKYFMGVADRNDTSEPGGKAYVKSQCNGEDFTVFLNLALPTRQDIVNLGIWVGMILGTRKQNVKIKN